MTRGTGNLLRILRCDVMKMRTRVLLPGFGFSFPWHVWLQWYCA